MFILSMSTRKGTDMKRLTLLIIGGCFLTGCATVEPKVEPMEAPVSAAVQMEAQQVISIPKIKSYKRKVVIGRFSNETNYGKALMTETEYNQIGRQASDMLSGRLVKSGQFLVFERPDLQAVLNEQELAEQTGIIAADTLIVGAVTEFGRSTAGKTGFLSQTKMQRAYAKVDIRLIDVRTGHAFFSATGAGEATTESGEVAGFGSTAGYDGTLNDRAIAAAISDVIDKLVSKLAARPWRTDILDIDGEQVYISGGEMQGIKVGDRLKVMQKTKTVKSKQSGFNIDLPAKKVADIRIASLFGEDETNQGAVGEIISGAVLGLPLEDLFVVEGESR